MLQLILSILGELAKEAIELASSAAAAKREAHQAILDRALAARAALRGERSAAHVEVEQKLAEAHAEIDRLLAGK